METVLMTRLVFSAVYGWAHGRFRSASEKDELHFSRLR